MQKIKKIKINKKVRKNIIFNNKKHLFLIKKILRINISILIFTYFSFPFPSVYLRMRYLCTGCTLKIRTSSCDLR